MHTCQVKHYVPAAEVALMVSRSCPAEDSAVPAALLCVLSELPACSCPDSVFPEFSAALLSELLLALLLSVLSSEAEDSGTF